MRILFACLMLVATNALAQNNPEEKKELAREHHKRGVAYIEAGAHGAALNEFLEAYKAFPNERENYFIAEAYRLLGHKRDAVEHYQKFLLISREGSQAEESLRYMAELTAEIEKEEAARQAEAQKPSTAEPSAATPAAPAAAVSTEPAPAPSPKKPRYWVVGVVVGVVAAAALGIGLGIGLGSSTVAPTPTYGRVGF